MCEFQGDGWVHRVLYLILIDLFQGFVCEFQDDGGFHRSEGDLAECDPQSSGQLPTRLHPGVLAQTGGCTC